MGTDFVTFFLIVENNSEIRQNPIFENITVKS